MNSASDQIEEVADVKELRLPETTTAAMHARKRPHGPQPSGAE